MNRRSIIGVVIAASLSYGTNSAGAAEESSTLSTVVVTATRYPTPIDEVLAPTIVITRQELQRSLATDVTEALRFHAGIDVARTGGPGQQTSVFIRGAESNHSLVLVDGVRINPGTIGNPALQNIPPELVERIEVVKGPRSVLYGTDAIGGVINIITRKPPEGSHLNAQLGAGADDTRQASLLAAVGSDKSHLTVSGSWIDSGGFAAKSDDDHDRGFENRSGGISGRTEVGRFDTGARVWFADGTSEYSDFFLTPVDQDFRNSVAAIDAGGVISGNWTSRMTVSRMQDRIEQNQADDRMETVRYAADWQNHLELSDTNRLTFGALYADENADVLSFGSGFDVDTETTTLYVQDQANFGRSALLVGAGYTDHDAFGTEAVWNAEYGIDVGGSSRLIFIAGTAFRAPDATDRFGFGGNPDLEAEESQNLEVGFRHIFASRHAARLSVYQNEIDQLITYTGTQLENVERARIRGVELSYEISGDLWRLRTEANYQEPENRDTGELLLRRAKESVSFAYTHRLGAWELGIDTLFAGDRQDFGGVELDSYVLASLSASYRLSRQWSVAARIENALDEDYELASGYNTPDRGLWMTVKYGAFGTR